MDEGDEDKENKKKKVCMRENGIKKRLGRKESCARKNLEMKDEKKRQKNECVDEGRSFEEAKMGTEGERGRQMRMRRRWRRWRERVGGGREIERWMNGKGREGRKVGEDGGRVEERWRLEGGKGGVGSKWGPKHLLSRAEITTISAKYTARCSIVPYLSVAA